MVRTAQRDGLATFLEASGCGMFALWTRMQLMEEAMHWRLEMQHAPASWKHAIRHVYPQEMGL